MRKLITTLVAVLLTTVAFAQTSVNSKKLGKTLEKNRDASAVFVSEIDLSKMSVGEDGTITLPLFAKNKISVVSGMDMANIKERIAYTKKSTFAVTFATKSLKPNVYAIIKIGGVETVEEYNSRIAAEERLERLSNITKLPVQIVNQGTINIEGTEANWLPEQVQDKLKSNLQEYLGMKSEVDAKSESVFKNENIDLDESTTIEFGKITSAKFALFVKIQKTEGGYTISADFRDLTTGEQLANITSKAYSKSEYLYGATGAADEITLSLANKLEIVISDLNKNLLENGSYSLTTNDLLILSNQKEERYKKMIAQYDEELARLDTSKDRSSNSDRYKLEAEKALLVEKQNAEKNRQEELKARKEREQADAKLDEERSTALKTQRDQLAKDATTKIAELRKVRTQKQDILRQINIIEGKKKTLVEIRQKVEERQQEIYDSLKKECDEEEKKIRDKAFATVELESGMPTQAAKRRRENQVWTNYENFYNKFLEDCETVKISTTSQDAALLQEIRKGYETLEQMHTVSSLDDDLKVNFGAYNGRRNGWEVSLSMYLDGILLHQFRTIASYEAVTGKKPVNLENETDEVLVEEYMENVDMYSSLLSRGVPIVYFALDYTVKAQNDDKPSVYDFNFNKLHMINTLNGDIRQGPITKVLSKTMKPEYDIREIQGVVSEAKKTYQKNLLSHNRVKKLLELGFSDEEISKIYERLPAEWVDSMSDDVLNDWKDAARNNIDKYVFTVGAKATKNTKHLLIPNSVTEIDGNAFAKCTSLKSVTIANSVTRIESGAFADCTSLKSVMMPNSVTIIGESVFTHCTSLESITISNSISEIPRYTFTGCTSLKSVTIPNSVTYIEGYAFKNCESLESITIPNSVTKMDDRIFEGCTSLKSATISTTYIPDYAFIGCTSLESLTIQNSVTKIGRNAFEGCTLKSITIPNSVTYIGVEAFSKCKSLTSITIPNSVTYIDGYAFSYCGFKSITIPNSVTKIGEGVFNCCASLTSVTIPNSIIVIPNFAFADCKSLTSITIPNSVTKIGFRAFYLCTSLASVTLPSSVTYIAEEAFKSCHSLGTVNFTGSKEEWNKRGFYYVTGVKINYNYRGK